ncbi:hypothetical protein Thermus77420_09090 [Thermus thalpophilus]
MGKSGASPALSRNGNRPRYELFFAGRKPEYLPGPPALPQGGHLTRMGERWGLLYLFTPLPLLAGALPYLPRARRTWP